MHGTVNGRPGRGPDRIGAVLREGTRAEHGAVDAAYGGYNLADKDGYVRFLCAHARILPVAEHLLAPAGILPGWRGRTAALASDLAVLGLPMPEVLPVKLPSGAGARWGALYVIEGSRLGGAVLARTVGPELPSAYLGATHGPGSWQGFLAALDKADDGPGWRLDALAGARAMFAAYLRAAQS